MPGKVTKSSSTARETNPAENVMDARKLIELVNQNKMKKFKFSFVEMLKRMSPDKIDEMWEDLSKMIIDKFESVIKNNHDTSEIIENNLNMCEVSAEENTEKSTSKQKKNKMVIEVGHLIHAAIDVAQTILTEGMPVSPGLLHLVVYLNGIIFELPKILENLKNHISLLCEKMFYMNYVENQSEHFTFNALKYLLIRSSSSKASKRDIKRVYALRSIIPKILALDIVDSNSIWELLKRCVVAKAYLATLVEGPKIISLALTMNVDRVNEVHNVIKKNLYSCNKTQASLYGKAYYEAWSYAVKEKLEELQKELEVMCIQDFILLAVQGKRKTLLENLQKLMSQFHYKKKETHVEKMLYALYQPILWRYVKSHDGLYRANSAALFLDVFPLENPDADIVHSDLELNDQMLIIKDLLTDEYPAVRICTIVKLCLAMNAQWELFPNDMINTYLEILISDLSHDSSTAEVRSSVAKGLKGLLQNPLSVPTLQTYLPRLKHLFLDFSYSVRVAFCQLLLSVKKIWGIKYFEIIPLSELLKGLVDDPVTAKMIVNLIHNSYFPKHETPSLWLGRCLDLINGCKYGEHRQFFQYIPRYVGVKNAAKFMVHVIKTIHFYMLKSKTSFEKSNLSINETNEKNDSACIETLNCEFLEKKGFHDLDVINRLFESAAILWLSCNLAKEDNKTELKMVVKNFSRYMEDLLDHYKDSPIWHSVFYLASFMPFDKVPSLAGLCFERLKTYNTELEPGDYDTLLQSLCNQQCGDEVLKILKDWIKIGLSQAKRTPAPKRRKTGEIPDTAKPVLGVQLLNNLLDKNPCQKVVFSLQSKQLKCFLELLGDLKQKIESALETQSTCDSQFLADLLFALMKISVLFHEEDKFNAIKFMEDTTVWVQEKLCKQVWGTNSLTNISRRSSVACKKYNSPCKELVMTITENLVAVLSDMTYIGYFNPKKCKFVKFGVKLLNFDSETKSIILLHVSKLLLKHIWSAIYLYKIEEETDALQIAPDCFAQIAKCLKDEEFMKSLPNSILKEIQLILCESTKKLDMYNNPTFRLSYNEHSSILSLCN